MNLDKFSPDVIALIANFLDVPSLYELGHTSVIFSKYFPYTKNIEHKFLFMDQEMIEEYPSMIIPTNIACWCNVELSCHEPAMCVMKFLNITQNHVSSITVNLSDRFDINELNTMNKVSAIKWDVNARSVDYRRYLEAICSPPDLKQLTIKVSGIMAGNEHSFNIDSIKEILNEKKIKLILKFDLLLPMSTDVVFASFPQITNNIDNVSIMFTPGDGKQYKLGRKMMFMNNKSLEIHGLTISGPTRMRFKNVNRVHFTNIKSDNGIERADYAPVDQPSILLIDRYDRLMRKLDGHNIWFYIDVSRWYRSY
jgi:hypothetical protein